MEIVGDNISDIAEFTIDKYEFRNDNTLSSEVREEAVAAIEKVLWKRVTELSLLRQAVPGRAVQHGRRRAQ